MNNNWIFLSYNLTPDLSAYANGEPIKITPTNEIKKGKTSNNSLLELPSHFGTHIDFPYHFSENGKTGDKYNPDFFIFKNVLIFDISEISIKNDLILPENLSNFEKNEKTDFIIIKTGFSEKRNSKEYWNNNYGFAPECAKYFKENFPNLRAIGFDTMSVSSFQNRPTGRVAHKEFLLENNILLVEDMNLSEINENTKISTLILSPLRFQNSDGAPLTIFAEIS